MFERFTHEAREAVVSAQLAARELGDARIGTEHLLLGVLRAGSSPGARVLVGLGVTTQRVLAALRIMPVDDLDTEALQAHHHRRET